MPSFWSVERDGSSVVATCPEALHSRGDARPEWMAPCAAAIREELLLLEVAEGTLLEATLIGTPPPAADLEDVLLSSVGVPGAHVGAGIRLRRLPASGHGVVQRYRRVPVGSEGAATGPLLAAVVVPVTDGLELDSALSVWLAVRRPLVAALPEGGVAPPGALALRVRAVAVSDRRRSGAEVVKKLLDGACAAFCVYDGPDLQEVSERAARALGGDPERIRALASSPRGALLGARACFALAGSGVQVCPAGDRIHAAEVTFVIGPVAQIEIELRRVAAT